MTLENRKKMIATQKKKNVLLLCITTSYGFYFKNFEIFKIYFKNFQNLF